MSLSFLLILAAFMATTTIFIIIYRKTYSRAETLQTPKPIKDFKLELQGEKTGDTEKLYEELRRLREEVEEFLNDN